MTISWPGRKTGRLSRGSVGRFRAGRSLSFLRALGVCFAHFSSRRAYPLSSTRAYVDRRRLRHGWPRCHLRRQRIRTRLKQALQFARFPDENCGSQRPNQTGRVLQRDLCVGRASHPRSRHPAGESRTWSRPGREALTARTQHVCRERTVGFGRVCSRLISMCVWWPPFPGSGRKARVSRSQERQKQKSQVGRAFVSSSQRPTRARDGPRSGEIPAHRRARSMGRQRG